MAAKCLEEIFLTAGNCSSHVEPEWSRESDLNRRPDDYKSTALPLSYPGEVARCREAVASVERVAIMSWHEALAIGKCSRFTQKVSVDGGLFGFRFG